MSTRISRVCFLVICACTLLIDTPVRVSAEVSPSILSHYCGSTFNQLFACVECAPDEAASSTSKNCCPLDRDVLLQACLEELELARVYEENRGDDKNGVATDGVDRRPEMFALAKRSRNTFLGKREEKKSRNTFLGKRAEDDFDDILKRARNTFLGKRSSVQSSETELEKKSRNTFLGKRSPLDEDVDEFRTEDKRSRNTFLGKRETGKSRNVFLGRRSALGGYDDDDDMAKRTRVNLLGKRNDLEEKRGRNTFLGKRDSVGDFHEVDERSRNQFLGKRDGQEQRMTDQTNDSAVGDKDEFEKRARNTFLGK